MEGSNKRVILIAAVGAVLVLALSTAVRLAIRRSAESAGEPAQAEAQAVSEETVAVARWRIPEPEGLADEIRCTGWAGDGGWELAVRGGVIYERHGEEVLATAFQVVSAEGDALHVLVAGTDGTREGDIVITRTAEGLRVESELFRGARSYRQREVAARVRIEGVPERYLELVGDWQGFAHGVEAYCETWVPGALTAAFSPEVTINADTGMVSATLVCDDAASTVVAVEWDGATFEVRSDGR